MSTDAPINTGAGTPAVLSIVVNKLFLVTMVNQLCSQAICAIVLHSNRQRSMTILVLHLLVHV